MTLATRGHNKKLVSQRLRKPDVTPLPQHAHLDADLDDGADEPEELKDRYHIP